MRASTVAAILAFTSGMTVNAAPVNVGEAISGAFEDLYVSNFRAFQRDIKY